MSPYSPAHSLVQTKHLNTPVYRYVDVLIFKLNVRFASVLRNFGYQKHLK